MRTMRKLKKRKKELEMISELVTGAEQSGVRMLWFTRFSIETIFLNIVPKVGSIKPMLEKILISQRHFDIRFTQDWHRIFFKLTKGLFKCRIV